MGCAKSAADETSIAPGTFRRSYVSVITGNVELDRQS
jgi:hypothetical protein